MEDQELQAKKNRRFWYIQLAVNIMLCLSGLLGIMAEDDGWPILPLLALIAGIALMVPLFFFKGKLYHL